MSMVSASTNSASYGNVSINGSNEDVRIGIYPNDVNFGFAGDITEVAMFDRALTSAEINQIYDYGLASNQSAGGDIKTLNGLAWASVKTKNGLANASIKTINGVTAN